MSDTPNERKEAELEEFLASDHAVVATTSEMDTARRLIEDLEEHGIPPVSIALMGAAPGGSMDDTEPGGEAETEALNDLAKSVVTGGGIGAVAGAVLGAIVALAIAGINFLLAAALGALFGSAVGGAAGGMSVAKYNSPARTETFETVAQGGDVSVGVHHADRSVVDAAAEVMGRHDLDSVVRHDTDDPGGSER